MWREEQVEGEGRDRTCGEEGEGHLCVCVCVCVCDSRKGEEEKVRWIVQLAHQLPNLS